MACIWKCMSYFPTSRAILQTSHEKGIFSNKELSTLLELADVTKGHSPWSVLLGPLHLSSLQEFLLGGLASMVGQSFLLAGSSPPNVNGTASAAIWASWWVGDNSSDPHLSQPLSLSHPLLVLPGWGLVLSLELGHPLVLGIPVPPPAPSSSFLLVGLFYPPSFVAYSLFWPCWKLEREGVSKSDARAILMRVMWYPFWISN